MESQTAWLSGMKSYFQRTGITQLDRIKKENNPEFFLLDTKLTA